MSTYSVTSKGTWSTSASSKTVSIGSYTILRYSYTPTTDGILTFSSSTTGIDTIGWINDSTSCVVSDSGYPEDSYYIGDPVDDADGVAFSATADVTANNTYYLYVCCGYGGEGGTVTLNIALGESGESGEATAYTITSKGTWSTSTTSKSSVSIASYTILRYSYKPTKDGTLTFSSSTAGVDTIGWINDSTSCVVTNSGYPEDSYYIGDTVDDADGSAFSATADVTANTTYYLYVCCYTGDSGVVTLNVALKDSGYSVTSKGSWSTSTASKSVSLDSYTILRYTYKPTKDGVLTFSSSTSHIDTIGWINSSTSCSVNEDGYPASGYYIGDLVDDANGVGFSATADVTANTTYYLYVCCGYGGEGGTVTLNAAVTTRPSDWSWTSKVAQGSQIALTAVEWNAFTSRINEFRKYAGLTDYSFTTAVSGSTPINATICNEAHAAIDDITGHGTLPAQLVLNGSLYASFFNGLKNALNAIE